MTTLVKEFTALVSILNERNVNYAVCGGWAMAILGAPRATMDIDVLVLSENLEDVWQAAKDLGYAFEGLPMSFHNGAVEIRRISKIDSETKILFTIDFLLVTSALQKVWETRQLREWEKGRIWVVSRDGLIKLKTISGRPQDMFDIEKLKELDDES